MGTYTYQFGRFWYGIRLDAFELFLGCPHVVGDSFLHRCRVRIKGGFIIIPWGAIGMANLPRGLSHALAQLLDLLLLPLVVLLPFETLRHLGLGIGVIVSLVFLEPVAMLVVLQVLV